jgi:hypothetical protein
MEPEFVAHLFQSQHRVFSLDFEVEFGTGRHQELTESSGS